MSRYTIVLFGLLAVMVAVYVEGNSRCHRDNESWNLCGKLCEPRCSVREPNPKLCPAIPCTKFTAACRCDNGYVRDANGSCVLRSACGKNQDQEEESEESRESHESHESHESAE